MAKRRGSRKIALETLYEHDLSGKPSAEILDRHADDAAFTYAATLVQGVDAHQPEIDQLISRYTEDWTLARMPPIDRTLLRLGVLELVYLDVPAAGDDQRGGGPRQAVLDRRLGPLRQRHPRPDRPGDRGAGLETWRNPWPRRCPVVQ